MEVCSLNHSTFICNYHIIWIPKCRKKKIFQAIRVGLGQVLRDLAEQKESKVLEGHLMPDHVHVLVSIPPKHAVAAVVGFMKGKSAIYIARNYGGRKRNFTGESFWARGYYCSTVGVDEETVRQYIRNQEQEDARLERMRLL